MSINPYQQYQNNAIMTASPGELTLMLYNGAIKFCNQAIEAINKQDISKAHEVLIKAQNIIIELQATLDTTYSIAIEMDTMYDFIKRLLIEGNIDKDVNKIEQAKEFITEFRDVWKQILK